MAYKGWWHCVSIGKGGKTEFGFGSNRTWLYETEHALSNMIDTYLPTERRICVSMTAMENKDSI